MENFVDSYLRMFYEDTLDDNEKPFKYKKTDVCQCIKNWLKTCKSKLPDEIEIPSNDFLKRIS